jgi:hypothetical protein
MGAPLPPPERAECARTVTAIRPGCSDEAFAAAWTEGRAMSLEQAVAYALQHTPTASDEDEECPIRT